MTSQLTRGEGTTPFTLAAGQSLVVSPARAGSGRRFCYLQHRSGGRIFYAIGRQAAVNDHVVNPGEYWEPRNAPYGAIYVYSDTGASGAWSDG